MAMNHLQLPEVSAPKNRAFSWRCSANQHCMTFISEGGLQWGGGAESCPSPCDCPETRQFPTPWMSSEPWGQALCVKYRGKNRDEGGLNFEFICLKGPFIKTFDNLLSYIVTW
ncbi:hypothetical protein M413DRAFT_148117 [Hebeloma cylindrosporum]|uniref:Uncharacterized protein n=1 Tax=Hebeloma cylindrosporum TaxID=76867 RepID=A0A0C3CCT1_HEBCY|nr:hypothetical protein M413DRAFT_148117 [Hebeloma cylindrosporum h7]